MNPFYEMAMLIDILREPNAAGIRVADQVEESCLLKTEIEVDNGNEYTTAVEYRFPGSDVIVHRSVHVRIKQWPGGIGAQLGTF